MEHISTFLTNSVSFGFSITLISFLAATWLYKKTHFVLFSPLFVSSAIVIAVLIIFKIPYSEYLKSADFLYYLMTPVTVALAIPLYRQFQKLRENALAIVLGIVSGIIPTLFLFLEFALFLKSGTKNTFLFFQNRLQRQSQLQSPNRTADLQPLQL